MIPMVERIEDLSYLEIDYLKHVHNYDIRDSTQLLELPDEFVTIEQFKEAVAKWKRDTSTRATSALDTQISGTHYKNYPIQPVKYIHANKIPFIEGCIIKYVTRWRDKGGVKDLEKAQHFIALLIELEQRITPQPTQ